MDVTLEWLEWSAKRWTYKFSLNCKHSIFYEILGKNYLLSTQTFIRASYFKTVITTQFYSFPNKYKYMYLAFTDMDGIP